MPWVRVQIEQVKAEPYTKKELRELAALHQSDLGSKSPKLVLRFVQVQVITLQVLLTGEAVASL